MNKKGRRPTHVIRYNSRFNPVRQDQVGELRELSDRKGRVGFLGRIMRVTKDRVAYKIEA
jgi:hypothetical protein